MEAEGEGPGAIAVAVFGFADEADDAGRGDFFFEAAEIGAEFVVANDAEFEVFEGGAEGKGEVLIHGWGEGDGLDLGAEAFAGAFGELGADASGVDAGALELWECQEAVEFEFELRKGAIQELDTEAVPEEVAELLGDVDDGEVSFAGDVDAHEELDWGIGIRIKVTIRIRNTIWIKVAEEVVEGEELEVLVLAGIDEVVGEEGG